MSNRKLLLADDSMTIQKVVNLTFADEGIDVTSVSDGDAAMQYLETERPDIILADVHMPGANGYQICERIRSNPETAAIPLILLAGSFEPFDEDEARRVGANASLRKPFESIRRLVDQVSELLSSESAISGNGEVAVEQETPPPDHPEIRDIDSLYRESVEPETGPELTTSPLGDPGMDDEMIETTYMSPVQQTEIAPIPAFEEQRGEQEFDAAKDLDSAEEREPSTGIEISPQEKWDDGAAQLATAGPEQFAEHPTESELQSAEPLYEQNYFEPIEAPAIVEGVEENENVETTPESFNEVQPIDYAPAGTDWEVGDQSSETPTQESPASWQSPDTTAVHEPHHEEFRTIEEQLQPAHEIAEESDLLDLPPVTEQPPPEQAIDELFVEEPRSALFSNEEIDEIAASVAEKLGSGALREIARVLVPHVIEEISVRRRNGFG